MDALVGAGGDDALREENWQLRQRLRYFESYHYRLERQNNALQQRVQQLETQLAGHSKLSRRRDHRDKCERQWLAKHDGNVRALLHIIRHHEAVNEELRQDLEQMHAKEAAAAVKVSRSAQTSEENACRTLADAVTARKVDTQTTTCIKHLYDQLKQAKKSPDRCSTLASQAFAVHSAAATTASPLNFRSSVVRRLQRNQVDHRSAIRPLPIIEEADENEDAGLSPRDGVVQVTQNSAKDQIATALTPPSGLANHYRDLEEQNRRLQERLESQQSLLDQLLSIKLDQVSSPAKSITDACVDKKSVPIERS